ncbi:MAG: permease [Vulcanimicrobiaceae bacterium]
MSATTTLLLVLGLLGVGFLVVWLSAARKRELRLPRPLEIAIGFGTNFFDTLGIGSFATTTSMFKLWRVVPDQNIPGTLNVGHTVPTIVQALIFISIVRVDPTTLCLLIVAATAGAWFGAGVVANWPRSYVQVGMGAALLTAAALFLLGNLGFFPTGGTALALQGPSLSFGVAMNFCLGALMTLGIGLYAPCMILISMLGMNPATAFPIMMGSCAFLMPVAGMRFIRFDSYALRASFGLALGGIPAVLIAAFLVKSLPLTAMRWLVIIVVVYAATAMLRSAFVERPRPAPVP